MIKVTKPEIFQLELSSKCNLACIMCPHPILIQRAKEHLDFELFKTIIDRDALPQTKVMGLHLLGESLLHPRFLEMVKYMIDRKVEPEVATNGTVLTEKMAWGLCQSGLKKIWLSFDGGTKETYEKIRVGANFEKTVFNIKRFLEINKTYDSPIKIIIQMVGQPENKDDLENFYNLWAGQGAIVKVKFLDTWAGTMFLDEVPNPPGERTPCEEPFNRVAVLANGDVVPCCRDWSGSYVYGNLKEQSLQEIWDGHKAESLRQEHVTGNYISEPCLSCREFRIPMRRDVSDDPDADSRQPIEIPLYLQGKIVDPV